MVDRYPHCEAVDQMAAIEDVKRDMESPRCMDRLLCGDVGYGKTEVAMRAAFKAIADGKQVAVLTPTTVLCYQHFETFKERFAAFPVSIDRKSTRLNSSHTVISYAVFCLEKKRTTAVKIFRP